MKVGEIVKGPSLSFQVINMPFVVITCLTWSLCPFQVVHIMQLDLWQMIHSWCFAHIAILSIQLFEEQWM